jgi:nucleotidyltransferase/DNA polymerase involved in DNA repair
MEIGDIQARKTAVEQQMNAMIKKVLTEFWDEVEPISIDSVTVDLVQPGAVKDVRTKIHLKLDLV